MTSATTSVRDRYDAASRPLSAVVAAVPAEAWAAPSPCEGWSALDVVAHLVDTQRSFLVDRGVALRQPPAVAADPAHAWAVHVAEIQELLADPEVADRTYDGYFGPTTIGESIVRFYVMDMVTHRWDIARAAGVDDRFTEDELDEIEAQLEGYGDAAYAQGVFESALTPPSGADRQTQVLARMGRRA